MRYDGSGNEDEGGREGGKEVGRWAGRQGGKVKGRGGDGLQIS